MPAPSSSKAPPKKEEEEGKPVAGHTCDHQHPCFVCGCSVCGYTVAIPQLSAAVGAHCGACDPPKANLSRLRSLLTRVVACRTCGRATHALCARHPLEARPWLSPRQLSPAERQSGLIMLQQVLARTQSACTHTHELKTEGAEAVEAGPQQSCEATASAPTVKSEPPLEETGQSGWLQSRTATANTEFPASPLSSSEGLVTSAVTTRDGTEDLPAISATAAGGASPAARPPRSPPPPQTPRQGVRRRATTATAGSPHSFGAARHLTGSLARSESPGSADLFFCSLDCALRLELCPNPFFDADMSARYEREAAKRLAALPPHTEVTSPSTLTPPAVLQVRYEAWLNYFAEDAVIHGRFPPFFPPNFTDADERVLATIAQLLTPAAQAQRLCGLDPAHHPVGSLLVVPESGLWEGLRLVEPGTSTTFVAEQLKLYLADAIIPTNVGKKRAREREG